MKNLLKPYILFYYGKINVQLYLQNTFEFLGALYITLYNVDMLTNKYCTFGYTVWKYLNKILRD